MVKPEINKLKEGPFDVIWQRGSTEGPSKENQNNNVIVLFVNLALFQ